MNALLSKAATRFEVKEMNDEARTFTGLASTWDLDLGGDVIRKGAFKATLKAWKEEGKVLPLIDSHRYGVEDVIGKMIEAKETPEGLLATFEMMPDDPKADAVYRRIKGGYVNGLSIGYEATKWEKPDEEDRKSGVWRILSEVKLEEVSVVLWPMNTGSRIADVKALADRINPDTMSDDDYRIARAVASQIGSILRRAPAPNGKGEDPAPGDAPPPPEGTEGTEGEPETPEAPPEGSDPEADATEGEKKAPLFLQEAVLARIERIVSQKSTTEHDDDE